MAPLGSASLEWSSTVGDERDWLADAGSKASGSSGKTGTVIVCQNRSISTTTTMSEPAAICLLEDIGALQFSGADAQQFLQGQLSNDLARLAPGTMLRAGLHNPQGRVLALLWLVRLSNTDVLALLPHELAASTAAHLRRYLLRAKLTLSDVSAHYRIYGIEGGDGRQLWPEAREYDRGRSLLIQAASLAAPVAAPMSRERRRAVAEHTQPVNPSPSEAPV